MKFKFEKFDPYKHRRSPIYYLSDKIEILKNKQFMQAKISSRINGPNTVYAEVYHSIEWPTNESQHWYHSIKKHFQGKNSTQSAMAWCNYLLNHPPNHYESANGHIDIRERMHGYFKKGDSI